RRTAVAAAEHAHRPSRHHDRRALRLQAGGDIVDLVEQPLLVADRQPVVDRARDPALLEMRRRQAQHARAIRRGEHVLAGKDDRLAAAALPTLAELAPAAGVDLESAQLVPGAALSLFT